MTLLALVSAAWAQPMRTEAERQKMASEAQALFDEAETLAKGQKPVEALAKAEKALANRRALYPTASHPNGHAELDQSIDQMARILEFMNHYGRSVPYREELVNLHRKRLMPSEFPTGYDRLTIAINRLGFNLQASGDYRRALTAFEETLELNRRLNPVDRHPKGHASIAVALNNIAFVSLRLRNYNKSLDYYEQTLKMEQNLVPPKDAARGNLRIYNVHTNIGHLLHEMGDFTRARQHFEKALQTATALFPPSEYPNGKSELALATGNMGFILQAQEKYEEAAEYMRRELTMMRRLYPPEKFADGHPELAQTLNNLSIVLSKCGRTDEAIATADEGLAVSRKCFGPKYYPMANPDLAQALNNAAYVRDKARRHADASKLYEEAVALLQKLYPTSYFPEGHRNLATGLANQAQTLSAIGEHAEAATIAERSMTMYRHEAKRFASAASESDALRFARSLPGLRDGYLTITSYVPGSDESTYAMIWPQQAMLTRVLQRRHAAARVAHSRDPGVAAKWDELAKVRSQIASLALNPGRDLASRDRRLTEWTARKDSLERELAGLLPQLARDKELDQLGPKDLSAALPKDAAFVDFIFYAKARPAASPIRHLLAFVTVAGAPTFRVELGEAQPIINALRIWRTKIQTRGFVTIPTELTLKLWKPVGDKLPATVQTLYIVPDGILSQLPWAALAGSRPNTILLEDYPGGIVVVPHGEFLLEQFKYRSASKPERESVMALGDVDYGSQSGGYVRLPGTAVEIKQIVANAGGRKITTLTGVEASASQALAALPQHRYIHLATHGFFAASELAAERKRGERGIGGQSPLAFCGLVFANANQNNKDGTSRITAEEIVSLPLENTRLVVLSACETALGDYAETGEGVFVGSEGVQGLQRAFHLAGCPNVVASLWNVNDAATAALMAKFYHELWVEKKSPPAALRSAQLFIYHHPELIPDVLGERGAPKRTEALAVTVSGGRQSPDSGASKNQGTDVPRSPTKLWAAFLLSGVGK